MKKKTKKSVSPEKVLQPKQEDLPGVDETKEKLEDLKTAAEDDDSTSKQFMDPTQEKKGKRPYTRRKPLKAEREALEAESAQVNLEQVKNAIRPAFGMLSNVGVKLAESPEAAIGPQEMIVMVDSATACVNQYLPAVLGLHANAIVLSLALGNWSLRVYMLRQAKLEQLREEYRRSHPPGEVKQPTGNSPPVELVQ